MPPYIICKGQGLRETLTNRQTLRLKLRSFKSSEHMRKGLGQTAVSATSASSVTLQIWQHVAKYNNCNFATFNSVVDTKNGAKFQRCLENESKPIIIFCFLRIPSLISKDQN